MSHRFKFLSALDSTSGTSMLPKIKNAAALHTPSHLLTFNKKLADFGPYYATEQTRSFASGTSDYIDILIATELDETIVDSAGKACCLFLHY